MRDGYVKGAQRAFSVKAIPLFVAGMTVAAVASFMPVANAGNDDRATTNYDRENDGGRSPSWQRAEHNTARSSVSGVAIESSNLPVGAQALQGSYDRIRQSSGWVALEDQVDDQTGRIDDLEDLLGELDLKADDFQNGSVVVSDWEALSGGASIVTWKPAISNQVSDFVQTKEGTQSYTRTVQVYERNPSTGEQELVDSFVERRDVDVSETRIVDVANNPGGGQDGWSDWVEDTASGSLNCGSWTPWAGTVDEGTSFTQARSCDVPASRSIYYLVDGAVIDQKSETTVARTIEESQVAVGTKKVYGKWVYDGGMWGEPPAGYTYYTGYYGNGWIEGGSCSPIGRKVWTKGLSGGIDFDKLWHCEK
ncbi:hypothetical protein [Marinobacter sp. tcs-11]|uniref:hypothetical protein n=1 Tax=Marinobacter sp. tcs-11 TaxID=1742860 RepID=UPI00257CDC9C|nr:hypothetical protein [Marinobacter sp. tcs-11]